MKTKHDWSAADALSDAEIHTAALADPDAQPLTEERLASLRRVPRAKSIRRALGCCSAFGGVISHSGGNLAGLEAGTFEPDAAARAYLAVIAREPDVVRRALEGGPQRER